MAIITITTQPAEPAPPTVTHYQEIAIEVMQALDQLATVMPKMEEAEGAGRKVSSARLAVPNTFCATVIAAVEQLPELAASHKLDPVAGRDKLQYIDAFRPVFDKLYSVTRRLRYALMLAKDDIAFEALQTYRIARQHASDKRSPEMAAHVENMKRDLNKRVPTKAEREQQKVEKLKTTVDEELNRREIEDVLAQHGKGVTKAA